MGQSGPESNSNEEVLHTPQNSRTGASPSDAIWCHTQDILKVKRKKNSTYKQKFKKLVKYVHKMTQESVIVTVIHNDINLFIKVVKASNLHSIIISVKSRI